jgi:hypothetical protein
MPAWCRMTFARAIASTATVETKRFYLQPAAPAMMFFEAAFSEVAPVSRTV